MKQFLITVILYSSFSALYAQYPLQGTYATEGNTSDSLTFKPALLFSHQGKSNDSTYFYGQGSYLVQNDSLLLTYTKEVPEKAGLKAKKGKGGAPLLYLKVYRTANTPVLYSRYKMLELLDKEQKVLKLKELKGDGTYIISDSLLSQAAYIRLAGDQDQLAPGVNDQLYTLEQPIDRPMEMSAFTFNRPYNYTISNTAINAGKIAFISDRQFVLTNGDITKMYTKKE